MNGTLDFLFARRTRSGFARQKNHADAILAERWQGHSLLSTDTTQMRIGQLDENAGAVTEQRIVAGRAAMAKIVENLQALLDNRMGLFALYMRDKTDAAGIVFVAWIV